MTDKNKNMVPNGININIRDPNELGFWTRLLRCTADEIKVAIYKVGCSPLKVREYIDKIQSIKNLSSAL
jgi:hypothetical protein